MARLIGNVFTGLRQANGETFARAHNVSPGLRLQTRGNILSTCECFPVGLSQTRRNIPDQSGQRGNILVSSSSLPWHAAGVFLHMSDHSDGETFSNTPASPPRKMFPRRCCPSRASCCTISPQQQRGNISSTEDALCKMVPVGAVPTGNIPSYLEMFPR